jgi:hypothetical protein
MFYNAKAIVSFTTNPIPLLTGAPGAYMFADAFYGVSGVTNLPADFMNTSGLTGAPADSMFLAACRDMTGLKTLPANFMNTSSLTGAPAASMFQQACMNASGLKTLPANFMNTTSLTGAPAASMFNQACRGMSGVTNLPANFLNTTSLTGAPAANMYNQSCYGMEGVISGDITMSSNITYSATNIASSMSYAFANMTSWTGTVYWGASRIYNAITNPSTDSDAFMNSTLVPGYTNMGANWK